MKTETILLILFTHFVADFVFQTDKQAINKSKSNMWLASHVATYMLGLFVCGFLIFDSIVDVLAWVVVNVLIHFIQDWFTSRINSALWKKDQRHWFFVGIGADQFMHYCALIITYQQFTSI